MNFGVGFLKEGDVELPQVVWRGSSRAEFADVPFPLFTLPDEAQVELINPPAGVTSRGAWGDLRRQLAQVYTTNEQLRGTGVDVSENQHWLCDPRAVVRLVENLAKKRVQAH